MLLLTCACRVVEKARQIADDQRKLATLMQDAAEAEARTPRSSSPGTLGSFVVCVARMRCSIASHQQCMLPQ